MSEDVICTVRGAIGHILLNRPKALNALTLGMVEVMAPALEAWGLDPAIKAVVIRGAGDRAFCAGGDVRAVWDAGWERRRGEGDGALTAAFFGGEYRLNRQIKRFPKPYVALMDGITMGGGVGLSVHGSHRVVTEKTLLAMPETGIGLFPDVGGTYFLPRVPGKMGLYLGLTGARVHAADLLYTGIGTHHVTSSSLDTIEAALAEGQDVDAVLAAHAVPAGEAPLAALRTAIDAAFEADDVEGIVAGLISQGTPWADKVAETILSMSPTSLKVTFEQLRRGAELEFDDCMRLEFRMTQAVMDGNDFYEGIRAVLVDKDKSPKWNPAKLADVSAADVARYFAVPPGGDLVF
ncbi:enoyl-CoA hydratase/isomerase family protein [Niveispirillum sp.]|uniref:enoyl-CoA hydratase/isomerase family protein n=1 Tax=Niveispirillum sp. TaxID=1917217 RepID=UPI001B6DF87E|nr:enoyl-CoA hydratase/isomerase family protein [Niveispirillum sp.]MBP7340400.1 enoyl-CoA hydratase/isomerase family protein [Niveispirillum sp.]